MKKILISACLISVLTGCAIKRNLPEQDNKAGFFKGVFHGAIAPITFFVSLVSDSITVWEVNNNGNWYTLGFLLGVGGISIGGSSNKQK